MFYCISAIACCVTCGGVAYVCVRERERERETVRACARERALKTQSAQSALLISSVCIPIPRSLGLLAFSN